MYRAETARLVLKNQPIFQRPHLGTEPHITLHRETRTFAVRKDMQYIRDEMTRGLLTEYALDEFHTRSIVGHAYDVFQSHALSILAEGLAHRPVTEDVPQQVIIFDFFDERVLNNKVLETVEISLQGADATHNDASAEPVTLDPLLRNARLGRRKNMVMHQLGVSRYSSEEGKSHVHRPGMPVLDEQIAKLPKNIVLVDDNSKTLGSMEDSTNMIERRQKSVQRGVVGINAGSKTQFITESGSVVPVDAVVTYEGEGNVDFLEPRDLLVGPGGAVDMLPDGQSVRLPFPLSDLTKEYGIHPAIERRVKERLLEANLLFYSRLQEQLGVPILLKHMRLLDVGTQVYLKEKLNISHHAPMDQVVRYFLHNLDAFQEITKEEYNSTA